MKNTIDFVNERYALKKWRVTAGVRNICSVFDEKPYTLFTPAKLCEALEGKQRPIDLTTAYRILERLEELHIVHQIDDAFIVCSDPSNTEEDHHFLMDEETGHAEEIFLDYRESIAMQLKQEKNFNLKDVSLVFYGRFDEE